MTYTIRPAECRKTPRRCALRRMPGVFGQALHPSNRPPPYGGSFSTPAGTGPACSAAGRIAGPYRARPGHADRGVNAPAAARPAAWAWLVAHRLPGTGHPAPPCWRRSWIWRTIGWMLRRVGWRNADNGAFLRLYQRAWALRRRGANGRSRRKGNYVDTLVMARLATLMSQGRLFELAQCLLLERAA